jgi:hypothetical protein
VDDYQLWVLVLGSSSDHRVPISSKQSSLVLVNATDRTGGNTSGFAFPFALFTLPDPRYKDTARNTSAEASRLI